jgi:hypothetical protein
MTTEVTVRCDYSHDGMGAIVTNSYDGAPVAIAPGEEKKFNVHGSNSLTVAEGRLPVAAPADPAPTDSEIGSGG